MYRLAAKVDHALYQRAFLLGELARAHRLGMAFPRSLWWGAFRRPSSVEDLANFKKPSFSAVTCRLEEAGLYPIIFQDFGRTISPYAFERDVIYVKRSLPNNIFGY